MKGLNKRIGTVILLLTIGLIGTPSDASQINFNVEAELPENQYDPNVTYFDLMMRPKATQEITIKASNPTDQDVTVSTQINTATTNSKGVVEYGESNTVLAETAPYQLTDIVKAEKPETVIKAHTTEAITLVVTMPPVGFEGVLAGGVTLSQKEEESSEQAPDRGMTIVNKYNYRIAIVLRVSDNKLTSNVELSNIKATQLNGQNVVSATIQNTEAQFLNQVSLTAKVTKIGKEEILYQSTSEGMQMAPNSGLAYPISLNEQKFKAGDYLLDLTVTSKDDHWTFQEAFSISSQEASALNKTGKKGQPATRRAFFLIGLVAIALGLASLTFMLQQRFKQQKGQLKKTS